MILAFTVAALLAQEPQPEAAPPVEAPPTEKPRPADQPKPVNVDELNRKVEKLKKMSPEDAVKAAEDLARHAPQLTPEEIKRQAEKSTVPMPEVRDYGALPETEQVKYSAR